MSEGWGTPHLNTYFETRFGKKKMQPLQQNVEINKADVNVTLFLMNL